MRDYRNTIQPEAAIDPPEPRKPIKSSGPIMASGLPYVEPEMTGEWPFCTVDQIVADYRRIPPADAAVQRRKERAG